MLPGEGEGHPGPPEAGDSKALPSLPGSGQLQPPFCTGIDKNPLWQRGTGGKYHPCWFLYYLMLGHKCPFI